MMRKVMVAALASVAAFLGSGESFAADDFAVDPVTVMLSTQPTYGARGMIFLENVSAGTSIGWVKYSHIPAFNQDGSINKDDFWNWFICNSWSDTNCPKRDGFTTEGKVILGLCKDGVELGCVEKFSITDTFGVEKNLEYLGPVFGGVIDIPEWRIDGIPRSSSPELYKDGAGNLYIVRAGLYISRSGTSPATYRLDVDVNPVAAVAQSVLQAPVVTRGIEPRTGLGNVWILPSPSECVATTVGICYKALKVNTDIAFGIDVRVPKGVSGWLRGRVSQPIFSARNLNQDSQIISVKAQPAVVPIAGGWATYNDLPANFINALWPSGGFDNNPNIAYFLVGNPSLGEQGTREYDAWTPYIGEKSLVTLSTWSFGTNFSSSGTNCLQQPGKISGFVASNAAVYSSNPPTWDVINSTLSYSVAAPHFDESGKENVGTYTLAMPVETIQCLYNQSNLPPSATVSIAYGSDVVSVATVTINSSSGWVYFAANGFHYSNPTITVKFAKPPTKEVATPAQPITAAPQRPVLKIQWCAKGYAKKKVTGTNPVCPKGYKKIAAP